MTDSSASRSERVGGSRTTTDTFARVCMLSFYFHPSYSGSAVQAQNLCRHIAPLGVQTEIVSANLSRSAPHAVVSGISVTRLPLLRSKPLQIPSFSLSLGWYLVRNRRSIDVVHAHGTFQHAFASIVCRLIGKRSVLKIAMGNSDIAFHRQGRAWGRANRFLVRQFDRYIATSREVYSECCAQGLDESRIRMIPNGVDTDLFRPSSSPHERHDERQSLGIPDRPVVCFVGIIDARKNVDGLLRVWRAVIRGGATGHLLIIGPEPTGSDGRPTEFCRRQQQFVADEGLGETVSFLGRQVDVAPYLRSSDIFFFPSRREGMPNVLLEAMASGLACIASRIGGSMDLIDDHKNGLLFDVDDEEGMAEGLALLLRDPSKVATLGRAARRAAVDRFSLAATAEKYVELYRQLLMDGAN